MESGKYGSKGNTLHSLEGRKASRSFPMMNPSLLVPPICLLLPPESLDSHKYNFQHKISIVLPLCTDTCLGCYDKHSCSLLF